MSKFQKTFLTASAFVALSATAATAATTPYDLIRPTWPLSWDSAAFENFVPAENVLSPLPKEVIPPNFKAGELMADTVDQAYLDAINQHISPIRVNQAGYLKSDTERQFYYVGDAETFEVVNAMGKSLSTKVTGEFTATATTVSSSGEIRGVTDAVRLADGTTRYTIDFTGSAGKLLIGNIPQSVPTETRLRIKVGDELSSTFIVSEDVYTMVKDAAIKFLGIQRSGNSESWFHGPSHTQDGAGPIVNDIYDFKGDITLSGVKAGDLQGGWYDAGDHLKESQTMSYVFMALAVMSATNPTKDVDHYAYNHADFVNTDNIPDMLREAKHGADFFLRAYRVADGVIDDMPVSVGDFGHDHGWWGRPEIQDNAPNDRGGAADRRVRLGELGATSSSLIAAGLAILSKEYAKYDKDFADSCLIVAEKLYSFAKDLAQGKTYSNNTSLIVNTPAYNGGSAYMDKLALASVALLYATGKEDYLNDALFNEDLCMQELPGGFKGGWFCNILMIKGATATSWASVHTYALYALYKLILSDKDKAKSFGLTEEERFATIESCILNMIANISFISPYAEKISSITLPGASVLFNGSSASYDPTWYYMHTQSNLQVNSQQAGNIFDVMTYSEVAADIEKQGITLPNIESPVWKTEEMRQLGINQLNYLLGVNPWDISLVYGVGDKNDNHPHHRASNPEEKNMQGYTYKYVRPVGAIYSGYNLSEEVPTTYSSDASAYFTAEPSTWGTTTLISALTFVSNGGNKYYEKKCDNCGKNNPNPFTNATPSVASSMYEFGGLDILSLKFFNNTMNRQDSLTTYIYYKGTEDEVTSCSILLRADICKSYDAGGFNNACSKDILNSINENLRHSLPIKIEDTYDKESNTYIWKQAIYVDSITYGGAIQFGISLVAGFYNKDLGCDMLNEPTKVDVISGWSLAAHEAEEDKPAYEGTPYWDDKDQDDIIGAPLNPYIVIERNGERLWGYAPNDTVEVKKDTTATDTSKSDSTKVDDKDDGKKDDSKKDDGKKDDSKKDNGKKDDSKKDSKKDGIIASIPSMQSSLHVARRTLIAQAPAQGTKALKIFDLLGNEVMSETFSGESATVNLSNVSKRGTLVARLVMNGKVLETKAIRVK